MSFTAGSAAGSADYTPITQDPQQIATLKSLHALFSSTYGSEKLDSVVSFLRALKTSIYQNPDEVHEEICRLINSVQRLNIRWLENLKHLPQVSRDRDQDHEPSFVYPTFLTAFYLWSFPEKLKNLGRDRKNNQQETPLENILLRTDDLKSTDDLKIRYCLTYGILPTADYIPTQDPILKVLLSLFARIWGYLRSRNEPFSEKLRDACFGIYTAAQQAWKESPLDSARNLTDPLIHAYKIVYQVLVEHRKGSTPLPPILFTSIFPHFLSDLKKYHQERLDHPDRVLLQVAERSLLLLYLEWNEEARLTSQTWSPEFQDVIALRQILYQLTQDPKPYTREDLTGTQHTYDRSVQIRHELETLIHISRIGDLAFQIQEAIEDRHGPIAQYIDTHRNASTDVILQKDSTTLRNRVTEELERYQKARAERPTEGAVETKSDDSQPHRENQVHFDALKRLLSQKCTKQSLELAIFYLQSLSTRVYKSPGEVDNALLELLQAIDDIRWIFQLQAFLEAASLKGLPFTFLHALSTDKVHQLLGDLRKICPDAGFFLNRIKALPPVGRINVIQGETQYQTIQRNTRVELRVKANRAIASQQTFLAECGNAIAHEEGSRKEDLLKLLQPTVDANWAAIRSTQEGIENVKIAFTAFLESRKVPYQYPTFEKLDPTEKIKLRLLYGIKFTPDDDTPPWQHALEEFFGWLIDYYAKKPYNYQSITEKLNTYLALREPMCASSHESPTDPLLDAYDTLFMLLDLEESSWESRREGPMMQIQSPEGTHHIDLCAQDFLLERFEDHLATYLKACFLKALQRRHEESRVFSAEGDLRPIVWQKKILFLSVLWRVDSKEIAPIEDWHADLQPAVDLCHELYPTFSEDKPYDAEEIPFDKNLVIRVSLGQIIKSTEVSDIHSLHTKIIEEITRPGGSLKWAYELHRNKTSWIFGLRSQGTKQVTDIITEYQARAQETSVMEIDSEPETPSKYNSALMIGLKQALQADAFPSLNDLSTEDPCEILLLKVFHKIGEYLAQHSIPYSPELKTACLRICRSVGAPKNYPRSPQDSFIEAYGILYQALKDQQVRQTKPFSDEQFNQDILASFLEDLKSYHQERLRHPDQVLRQIAERNLFLLYLAWGKEALLTPDLWSVEFQEVIALQKIIYDTTKLQVHSNEKFHQNKAACVRSSFQTLVQKGTTAYLALEIQDALENQGSDLSKAIDQRKNPVADTLARKKTTDLRDRINSKLAEHKAQKSHQDTGRFETKLESPPQPLVAIGHHEQHDAYLQTAKALLSNSEPRENFWLAASYLEALSTQGYKTPMDVDNVLLEILQSASDIDAIYSLAWEYQREPLIRNPFSFLSAFTVLAPTLDEFLNAPGTREAHLELLKNLPKTGNIRVIIDATRSLSQLSKSDSKSDIESETDSDPTGPTQAASTESISHYCTWESASVQDRISSRLRYGIKPTQDPATYGQMVLEEYHGWLIDYYGKTPQNYRANTEMQSRLSPNPKLIDKMLSHLYLNPTASLLDAYAILCAYLELLQPSPEDSLKIYLKNCFIGVCQKHHEASRSYAEPISTVNSQKAILYLCMIGVIAPVDIAPLQNWQTDLQPAVQLCESLYPTFQEKKPFVILSVHFDKSRGIRAELALIIQKNADPAQLEPEIIAALQDKKSELGGWFREHREFLLSILPSPIEPQSFKDLKRILETHESEKSAQHAPAPSPSPASAPEAAPASGSGSGEAQAKTSAQAETSAQASPPASRRPPQSLFDRIKNKVSRPPAQSLASRGDSTRPLPQYIGYIEDQRGSSTHWWQRKKSTSTSAGQKDVELKEVSHSGGAGAAAGGLDPAG